MILAYINDTVASRNNQYGERILKRYLIIIALCILGLTACGKYSANKSDTTENQTDSPEIAEAKEKLKEHCRKLPTSFGSELLEYYCFDVNGDGNDDVCTDCFFGSGMPRNAIFVYDYINDKFYSLDDFPNNFSIGGIEDGKLIVKRGYQVKIGHGYDKRTEYGTIKFENDTLTFVGDPK